MLVSYIYVVTAVYVVLIYFQVITFTETLAMKTLGGCKWKEIDS